MLWSGFELHNFAVASWESVLDTEWKARLDYEWVDGLGRSDGRILGRPANHRVNLPATSPTTVDTLAARTTKA